MGNGMRDNHVFCFVVVQCCAVQCSVVLIDVTIVALCLLMLLVLRFVAAMGFFLPILGILFTGPGLIFIVLTKSKTGRIWYVHYSQ